MSKLRTMTVDDREFLSSLGISEPIPAVVTPPETDRVSRPVDPNRGPERLHQLLLAQRQRRPTESYFAQQDAVTSGFGDLDVTFRVPGNFDEMFKVSVGVDRDRTPRPWDVVLVQSRWGNLFGGRYEPSFYLVRDLATTGGLRVNSLWSDGTFAGHYRITSKEIRDDKAIIIGVVTNPEPIRDAVTR